MTSIVFTVDTEPDDQWSPKLADGNYPPFTFANTRGLGPLIRFFRERNAPVTWMTSYSIARDPESVRVLRDAAAGGDEIAGHLHGWETPPFAPFDRSARPFIYEYDDALRLAKHQSLVAAHEGAFGARPVSYRAGRWGVDALELQHITRLGYAIDSSIAPGIDFTDRFGLRAAGPDFRDHESPLPYRMTAPHPPLPLRFAQGQGHLLPARGEKGNASGWVPANKGEGPLPSLPLAPLAGRGWREAPGEGLWEVPASLTRIDGALIWVRPLKHPRALLVEATHALLRSGVPILNVMFHSSEAFVGTSPVSRQQEDVERLLGDLDAILTAAREHGADARTLRDATFALGEPPRT